MPLFPEPCQKEPEVYAGILNSQESDGIWRLREYFSTEEVVEIKSIQVAATIKEIYERVSPTLKGEI